MTQFIPELKLAKKFYIEAVEPVIGVEFPHLSYSAALIGDGSGVLGYDTTLSRDHDWGPRLHLFVEDRALASRISSVLDQHLPQEFLGYPVRFSKGGSPVRHHVDIHALGEFLHSYLGISSFDNLNPISWLAFPQENLLTLTAGEVFHDDADVLRNMRQKLAYYPHDIWLYMLASGWRLLSQEMPFVGRTAEVGDELGSKSITTHQCRRAMQLLFLIERKYAPYNKWFGTAFKELKFASSMDQHLASAMKVDAWEEREHHLNEVYKVLVTAFNELKLLDSVKAEATSFFDRPYSTVEGPAPEAIQAKIQNTAVRSLPLGIGNIDQVTDNVDILSKPVVFSHFQKFYADLSD
ncbi:MAG TPA: DUF4037 domain-containing protein [Candidatus Saccharimonadia bacterium]